MNDSIGPAEREVVARQLGRPPRALMAVAHRCPSGQRVPGEGVQALHAVGHPAGAHARGQHVAGVAGRQVRLVRGAVAGGQLGVGGQLVLPVAHPAGGLQPARGRRRPGAGQVVEGGERRAVLQAGRGLDDVGLPAGAAVRDGDQRPGWAAQLTGDDLALGRTDRVVHGRLQGTAPSLRGAGRRGSFIRRPPTATASARRTRTTDGGRRPSASRCRRLPRPSHRSPRRPAGHRAGRR